MTELILKPQNSTEWLYSVNGDFVEYVADGNNFSTYSTVTALNVAPAIYLDTEQVVTSALSTNTPNGNWQGYYQTTQGISDKPSIVGESRNITDLGIVSYTGINLCSPSLDLNGGNNGIYQEVYGLTVGSDYSFTVDYRYGTIHANSVMTLFVYDMSAGSPVLVESETINSFTSSPYDSYDMPFTATSSDLVLVINFWSQVEECIAITNVGLTETWETVSYSLSDFTDGSVSLDLFEESIPLTLSVSEFANAVDNIQSYSKDFRLPSTKRNDKVFSHIYNLDSSIEGNNTAFNPYVKTIATLKEDNIEIFTGELTLNSIDKGSEGVIYNVHLQSIVTGLASVLKGRTLGSLNFSELRHDFTAANIKNSWTDFLHLQQNLSVDSLARDQVQYNRTSVIKYPFVNWTGNLLDPNNNGDLLLENLEQVYRPWISAKYILDRIFRDSGFSYDSSFLNSSDFTNLYMDFNHGGENGASAGSSSGGQIAAEWDASSTRWISDSYTRIKLSNAVGGAGSNVPLTDDLFDYANGAIQPLVDNTSMQVSTQIMLYNETNNYKNVDVRLVHETLTGVKNDLAFEKIKILGSPTGDPHGTFAVSVNVTLALGDKVYAEARTSTSTSEVVRQGISDDDDSTYIKIYDYGSDAVDFETILDESRGDIGQWDFIKSLMNMFNLLIMPTENPNRFKIEPYDTVFGQEGYRNLLPMGDDFVISGLTQDTGTVTTQTVNSITMVGDGTQTHSYSGAFRHQNNTFIDGESYVMTYDVTEFTTDTNPKVQLYNNFSGFTSFSLEEISSVGSYSQEFVYKADSNNRLTFQFQMQFGTGTVKFENIKMIGKFSNETTPSKDWTNKIDEDTFKIEMQDLDKSVDFSFVNDSDDYVSKIYSEETSNPDGTAYNYGDLKYVSHDYTALTSESNVSITPFASTIIKPLNDYSGLTDLTVPCIYKKEDENVFKVYKNQPRLLYNNGIKSFSGTYESPYQNGQNGFSSENEYLQFSHFSEFDNTVGAPDNAKDYNFRNCPSLVTNATVNGLFNEFWATYYDEKYHPDTRIYNVKALLTPNDIFNFEYTDIIRIKNQEFRVNNMQYNPKGMSNINLIKLP
tara:strand:+ start:1372 stop:4647 length:3276 start_codon:yes stop_codon:yes gene_type:complete